MSDISGRIVISITGDSNDSNLVLNSGSASISESANAIDLQNVESSISTLQTNQSTLQSSVSTLQTNQSSLQSSVSTLESNVTEITQLVPGTTLVGNKDRFGSGLNYFGGLQRSLGQALSNLHLAAGRAFGQSTLVSNDITAMKSVSPVDLWNGSTHTSFSDVSNLWGNVAENGTASWEVVAGDVSFPNILTVSGETSGFGTFLVSSALYENFVLDVVYYIDLSTNGGIFVRMAPETLTNPAGIVNPLNNLKCNCIEANVRPNVGGSYYQYDGTAIVMDSSSVYGAGTGTFTGVTQRLLADSNGASVIGGSGKWCSARIYSMNRYHKFLLKDGLPSEDDSDYISTAEMVYDYATNPGHIAFQLARVNGSNVKIGKMSIREYTGSLQSKFN